MEIICKNAGETKALARRIANKISPGMVLALYGDLGSGKTTFTRFLVEGLEIDKRVQSPTFVLMRKYTRVLVRDFPSKINCVNHFDLYRLESSEDLLELSMQEIFEEPNSISIIEWAEIAEHLLPKDCIKMHFEFLGEEERKIKVEGL